jgi:D-alanyl-D-alanine carboxypeptidase (penicillin-binding protein 5/6)
LKRIKTLAILGLGAMLAASPPAVQAVPAAPTGRESPIALLVDLQSGQPLHSREADRRFLPASVTKVMTAYVAFELIAAGKLSEDQVFTVRPETAEEWSGLGSTMFLQPNQQVAVFDLLRGITSVSANDGCVALAEGTLGSVEEWVAEMNRTAARLGMDDSHFGTPNGYPDEGRTYVSAGDLVKLADALITRHPKLYGRYFGRPGFTFNGFTQPNHDPITGVVAGADGIKTGHTREAGFTFLGSAERNGRRLAMVIAGIEGGELRNRIARDYIEWGFAAFDNRPIFARNAVIGSARVQNGDARYVDLVATRGVFVSAPKGTDPGVTMKLRYLGPVQAPFKAGDAVAELEISVEGQQTYRIPLAAAEDVGEANLFERLLNGVLGLFL